MASRYEPRTTELNYVHILYRDTVIVKMNNVRAQTCDCEIIIVLLRVYRGIFRLNTPSNNQEHIAVSNSGPVVFHLRHSYYFVSIICTQLGPPVPTTVAKKIFRPLKFVPAQFQLLSISLSNSPYCPKFQCSLCLTFSTEQRICSSTETKRLYVSFL